MMPQELVYPTEPSEMEKHKVVSYDGIPLLVEMGEDHCYQVIRVLSSDPSHYLDSRCIPGAKIPYA
jgi:hypothetical protein